MLAMKQIAYCILGAILLWHTPSNAQTKLLESPWEMAVEMERWLIDGAGVRFLPGMEEPARDDDAFVFVDETWPMAFQSRIGESIFLSISPNTGCYEFEDIDGNIFWTIVPYEPLTENWISPFLSPLHPDTQNLFSPFRLVREWRLTTPELQMSQKRFTTRSLLRSVDSNPVTNLTFTAFSITNDVLFFTVDWPTNQPPPTGVLDVWCSTSLSEEGWTNIWIENVVNPPHSFAFSTSLVPDCDRSSLHNHNQFCVSSTNIVISPLDGLMTYTNEIWSCDTNRTLTVSSAFFQLGTRADNDGDGLIDTWEKFFHGTNPHLVDTDGDTMPDGWEVSNGLNPLDYFDSILDLDEDGIPNVYEFHNDTNPRVPDSEDVPLLVVGEGDNGLLSLEDAFEQSTPYSVIVVPDGLYQGPGWTGVWFPSHPILLTSENAVHFRRTVIRLSGSSLAAFYLDAEQSPHTIIRGLDIELAGSSGFQTAFWLGNGDMTQGPGASAMFQNVHVKFGVSTASQMGWFCRHSTARPTILSGCSVNAEGAINARGIYAIDSPDIFLEGCSFMNFPNSENAPAYAIQTESTRENYGVANDPVNISIQNCLFDNSFTNAFVIAPLINGVSYKTSMRSCVIPSPLAFSVDSTNNLIVAENLVRVDGHLLPDSEAINAGLPFIFWKYDFDGEPRGLSPDIGADEWSDASTIDSDGDGLMTDAEMLIWGTDPFRWDTDGDSIPDNEEIVEGTNPNDGGNYCFSVSGTIESSATTSNLLYLAVVSTNTASIQVLSSILSIGPGSSTFAFPHTVVTNATRFQLCLFADYSRNGLPDWGENLQFFPLTIKGHSNVVNPLLGTIVEDQDNDYIPDAWEYENGLCFTNANDACEDPDDDGLINLHECWHGKNPWVADGSDTILSVLSRSIDSRLTNKNPEIALPFFLNYANLDSGTVSNALIANPNCWASDLDFSCESPWNSESQNRKSGTLVSPIHILLAEHHSPPPIGTKFYFSDSNGNVYVRRTVAKQPIVSSPQTDLVVALLDAELPPSIKPAKILPSDYRDYIGTGRRLPAIKLDQEGKILVSEILNIATPETAESSSRVTSSCPQSALREPFYEELRSGDSSNPKFLLLGNQLILLCIHWGPSYGSSLQYYTDLVNEAMRNLLPNLNYQLESVDFSEFEKLPEVFE